MTRFIWDWFPVPCWGILQHSLELLPGYSLHQNVSYFSSRLLCILCPVLVSCVLIGQAAFPGRWRWIFLIGCGKQSITLSHLICPEAAFLFQNSFCLSLFVRGIPPEQLTPAVVISDMAISAGSAVISDNGGHFLRHRVGGDNEPSPLWLLYVNLWLRTAMTHSMTHSPSN